MVVPTVAQLFQWIALYHIDNERFARARSLIDPSHAAAGLTIRRHVLHRTSGLTGVPVSPGNAAHCHFATRARAGPLCIFMLLPVLPVSLWLLLSL